MNYYPAENTGLSACTLPLYKWIKDKLMPEGERVAEELYGKPGWTANIVSNAYGFAGAGLFDGWMYNILYPTGGAWITTHIWEHYLYTRDLAFLEEYYPVLYGCARFLASILMEEPDTHHLLPVPSYSPENDFCIDGKAVCGMCAGSTHDIVIVKYIFQCVIEASTLLQKEDDFVAELSRLLPKLPPFKIGKYGQLQEWYYDYEEANPDHRHISHVLALHPFNLITPEEEPEFGGAVRKTFERRLGDNAEDIIHANWAGALLIIQHARLLDGEKAGIFIQPMISYLSRKNLMITHQGPTTSETGGIYELDGNTGFTAGVAEMLLQSYSGNIHVLPAIPSSWSEGSYTGLVAYGGHRVSTAWNEKTVTDSHIEDSRTIVTASFSPVYHCKAEGNRVLWESEYSPYDGKPYFLGENGLVLSQHFQCKTGYVFRTGSGLFYNSDSVESLSSNSIQIRYTEEREIETGDIFQMRDIKRDACGIFQEGCNNTAFSHLQIGYLYAMGVISQCCENTEMSHIRFKSFTDGMSSASAADMLHFSGCRGKIHIHDCEFDNPHDDFINVHGTFLTVNSINDNRVLLQYSHPQTLGFPSVFTKNSLQFYNSDTLLPLGEPFEVIEASTPTADDLTHFEVLLDRSPNFLLNEENGDDSKIVVENITLVPDVLIENNQFIRCPTRGVLVSTSGEIIIRNNSFSYIKMACIFISCDANDWYESGPVRDVRIENNLFSNCDSYAVFVEPTNSVLGEEKVHKNIKIINNTICTMPFPAISVKSSSNVVIKGNNAGTSNMDEYFIENISSDIRIS